MAFERVQRAGGVTLALTDEPDVGGVQTLRTGGIGGQERLGDLGIAG